MGRLFWKIFFAFWLTLIFIAAGVGLAVHLHSQARLKAMTELAAGPRAELILAAVATTLEYGGPQAVRSLFKDWPGRRPLRVLIVDENGHDLLGRAVPAAALVRARAQLGSAPTAPGLRHIAAPNGHTYLLFVPIPERVGSHRPARRYHVLPVYTFRIQLGMALLASLLFSAGLAWYLTRPVRYLRQASQNLAEGELDTRVTPLIGRRRDEIADLGRDFDHMAARLQTSVTAQMRLLHDVSHELRSPLARLRVAIGLARQQPNKMAAALDRIERESERLAELVGQVLTLSRLEAGVSGAPEEYVDLTQLLDSVVEDARFEAESSGRRVSLDAAGEVIVKARAELLRRALENVIRNAVKYTAAGTTVEVCMRRRDERKSVTVSICDRGPGVPASELETVFKPFFRVDSTDTSDTGGGYGLGLAIAKRAVEAHAGRIHAENRAGGGLCIEISLPLTAAATPR
jgi:two-component system OmpR family sensor kinase